MLDPRVSDTAAQERLILGIDATESSAHVAISQGEVVLASASADDSKNAESLLTLVSTTLTLAGCVPKELGEIVVALGPGSFTGIRIGLATAQGFALPLGLPVTGISVLLARLSQSVDFGKNHLLFSHKAAYQEERYVSKFNLSFEGSLSADTGSKGRFSVSLCSAVEEVTLATEDQIRKDALSIREEAEGLSIAVIDVAFPGPIFESDDSLSPAGLLLMAKRRFVVAEGADLKGHLLENPSKLKPLYVKRPPAKTLSERGIAVR